MEEAEFLSYILIPAMGITWSGIGYIIYRGREEKKEFNSYE